MPGGFGQRPRSVAGFRNRLAQRLDLVIKKTNSALA